VPEVASVSIPIQSSVPGVTGTLELSTLPTSPGMLWDLRGDAARDTSLAPIQLSEGREYRYRFSIHNPTGNIVETDRPEIFVPDDLTGMSGRLKPGLFTGTAPIGVIVNHQRVAEVRLEIRSVKLEYLRDYRWMLRDVADIATELAMDSFAPSEQRFQPNADADAATLYQRFSFLRDALHEERFVAAVRDIIARPHVTWIVEETPRNPSRGCPADSNTSRQFARPSPRMLSYASVGIANTVGVPTSLQVRRTIPSVDNAANQFVKFALERWLTLVNELTEATHKLRGGSQQRATFELTSLREHLDGFLAESLFREVSSLAHFPSSNQVLQKREGYRDIFRLYAMTEVASQLSWSGGDDVYGAGLRDVATLYEYWVFLQLGLVLESICGGTFDWGDLVAPSNGGLNLDLRRGKSVRLRGTVSRSGRQLEIELFFNKTFSQRSQPDDSWTLAMRPDCSVRIRSLGTSAIELDPVWLHFDAKYRIDRLAQIMGSDDDLIDGDNSMSGSSAIAQSSAKRDDLLKMHAYRDAIRQSAGAYVLYPGTKHDVKSEFTELLPGLGAFALRPADTVRGTGSVELEQFILDSIGHLARQTSQHERGRFWERASYSPQTRSDSQSPFATFLTHPPADTQVLVGYVRSEHHRQWIREHGLYNLRADNRSGRIGIGARELGSQLAVLYSSESETAEIWRIVGSPVIATKARMLALGYPEPGGDLYICVQLGSELTADWSGSIPTERIRLLAKEVAPDAPRGSPFCIAWSTLLDT
jgi:predicted component of viral defense system (DUF524 family)